MSFPFFSDVTSLYPWCQKYQQYAMGHPEIITDNFDRDFSKYYGLAVVTVLPPRGLYHPVLPYRNSNGKLLFALCKTCADSGLVIAGNKRCKCGPSQREITGELA